jgi:hypothetical protein
MAYPLLLADGRSRRMSARAAADAEHEMVAMCTWQMREPLPLV